MILIKAISRKGEMEGCLEGIQKRKREEQLERVHTDHP